uniref:Uncharacterized protein n=1 Tax=Cacopsylla melanoneura TaxID=428564 RepID=A0A8D9B7Z2_9HEMI
MRRPPLPIDIGIQFNELSCHCLDSPWPALTQASSNHMILFKSSLEIWDMKRPLHSTMSVLFSNIFLPSILLNSNPKLCRTFCTELLLHVRSSALFNETCKKKR